MEYIERPEGICCTDITKNIIASTPTAALALACNALKAADRMVVGQCNGHLDVFTDLTAQARSTLAACQTLLSILQLETPSGNDPIKVREQKV